MHIWHVLSYLCMHPSFLLPSAQRDPPRHVLVKKEGSSSLRISWSHPNGGQPTSNYSVFYTCISVSRFDLPQQTTLTVSRSRTSLAVDLNPDKYYTFIVTAVSGTSSESSDLVQFYRMLKTIYLLICCVVNATLSRPNIMCGSQKYFGHVPTHLAFYNQKHLHDIIVIPLLQIACHCTSSPLSILCVQQHIHQVYHHQLP